MAIHGPTTAPERALEERHREEGLKEIERIRESAPEHHKADIERLWHLIRDAAGH